MSLLTIIQRSAAQIGLPQPTTVISNTDLTVARLLEAAQDEGEELATKHPWTILQREHTFTTTASTAEYALPSDFATLLNDTAWDRAEYQSIRGPLTAQEWQVYKSGIIGGGIVKSRWRIKRAASGNTKKFVLDPTPDTTGDTIVFEYRSNGWCQSSGGSVQSLWAADTDTGILDERLIRLGTVWRFLRSIGNDFDTQLLVYEDAVSRAIADDLSPPVLTLHRSNKHFRLGGYVPETGFGS